MKVVDFRCRPNTAEFMGMFHYPGSRWARGAELAGTPLPPAVPLEEFVAEMDRAGVDIAVFIGRDLETMTGWKVPNEHVADCARRFPKRIVGIGGIDPLKGRQAVADVEHAISDLGLKGVAIDPSRAGIPANDVRMYPIYSKCAELGVPVVLTIGPLPTPGVYMRMGSPVLVDEVATELPELKIVCSHGGWPWADEMVAIAWRHKNVYFETSMYHFVPGNKTVVEAANTIIPNKLMFATAYPFPPLKETLEKYKELPFKPEVLKRVLYDNAVEVLGLAGSLE